MKLVGIEEHFLTPEVRAAWDAAGLGESDPSVAFHAGDIERRLLNYAHERLALMDETGLDVQVLSLTTPALNPLGPESVDMARRINDAIAGIVARHPARFQAFATLAFAVPEAAARELERCVSDLGFAGTMVHGRVGLRNLDDPAFEPILAAAAQLRAPVFLHPQTPVPAVREVYYGGFSMEIDAAFATFGIGWHYETGIQFLRLVLSGVFDRLPSLQVVLGHWGEVVLFYAERIARMDGVAKLCRPIETCLRENLYVTPSGLFLKSYLDRCMALVGPDRLLFSTDFPYQYRPGRDARNFLETCGLDAAATNAFAHGNWDRLMANIIRKER